MLQNEKIFWLKGAQSRVLGITKVTKDFFNSPMGEGLKKSVESDEHKSIVSAVHCHLPFW